MQPRYLSTTPDEILSRKLQGLNCLSVTNAVFYKGSLVPQSRMEAVRWTFTITESINQKYLYAERVMHKWKKYCDTLTKETVVLELVEPML